VKEESELYGMFKRAVNRLRDFKFTYVIYNFFHRRKLGHNQAFYKKFRIKKPVYWNVSSEDFANLPQQSPWLDEPGAREALLKHEKYLQLPLVTQQHLLQWMDCGFIILKNFLLPEEADAINDEISLLLEQKKVKPLANGKIMFAFKQSALLKKIVSDERITKLFEFIFQQPVIPFQSINFLKGSQQCAHSDSIHMTTYPLGYLSAAWFALEDIDDKNGSLFYYPGSHKLPYVLSPDFDHKSGLLQLDPDTNSRYEERMAAIIATGNLVKTDFYASKGDVFLWHANLIHGGNAIADMSRTRKSMVVHYFARNVIKYHEISQRPALLEIE
jgi:ectoine hydroxylase